MREPNVRARRLSVEYQIRHHHPGRTLRSMLIDGWRRRSATATSESEPRKRFFALAAIDLEVMPGEVVGIIGRNGSGKTTLLKAIAGIISVDAGEIAVRGRLACLMGFGVGFNPSLTGRENIYLSGSLIGIPRREIEALLDEIIEFSELGDFIEAPIRTYSRGMRVRLGFAVASRLAPEVLLLDEVLAAGDAAFRAKAGDILAQTHKVDQSVLLASHSMPLVRRICNRVLWLDGGRIRLQGDPDEVCNAYLAAAQQSPAPAPPAGTPGHAP